MGISREETSGSNQFMRDRFYRERDRDGVRGKREDPRAKERGTKRQKEEMHRVKRGRKRKRVRWRGANQTVYTLPTLRPSGSPPWRGIIYNEVSGRQCRVAAAIFRSFSVPYMQQHLPRSSLQEPPPPSVSLFIKNKYRSLLQ
ncbi:hypothetical protein ACS0PU_005432 [Formica fusca]